MGPRPDPGQQQQCHNCGLVGHLARDYRKRGPGEARRLQYSLENGSYEVLQLPPAWARCFQMPFKGCSLYETGASKDRGPGRGTR